MNQFTLVLIFLLFTKYSNARNTIPQPVNSVLGDASYLIKYQKLPDKYSNEVIRIQTHLEYVENLLRNTSTKHLNKHQPSKTPKTIQ